MKITRTVVVLDAADIDAVSAFWAGLLGGTVEKDDDWHSILVDGQWRLGVQHAPNHTPPGWPDGTQQQVHLDLWVEDPQAAHERAIALGAQLLKPAEDTGEPDRFQVYADPAGHPFCLCWVTYPPAHGDGSSRDRRTTTPGAHHW
jgi:predicted enzyme related to lactoylglutathione lyase